MLFGKEIIDDPNKFAENLILNAMPDISDESKTNWMTWLMTTLTGANGLVDIYKSSKTTVDKKISDYKTTFYNPLFNRTFTALACACNDSASAIGMILSLKISNPLLLIDCNVIFLQKLSKFTPEYALA